MKKQVLLACSLVLSFASSTPMFADTLFNFSFTGNSSVTGIPGVPFSGSGQFDTQATATAGTFLITGVTGTTDGQIISSILAPSSYGFNDNLLLFDGTNPAMLDNAGVSYVLANGTDANLFRGVPAQDQQTLFGSADGLVVEAQTAPISITPSPVPEPGSIGLLGTGALGLLGVIRRRIAA